MGITCCGKSALLALEFCKVRVKVSGIIHSGTPKGLEGLFPAGRCLVFQGAEVDAQEAFECGGESGCCLTASFVKRNQTRVIQLDAACCFCLCVGGETNQPNPN